MGIDHRFQDAVKKVTPDSAYRLLLTIEHAQT